MRSNCEFAIRPLERDDREAWLELWAGYCEFYGVNLTASVTNSTWVRLLHRDGDMRGFVAIAQRRAQGFANLVFHDSTWSTKPIAYLEDLFVRSGWRGQSIGRSLISIAIDYANLVGCEHIYWITSEDNRTARRLYDEFTPVGDVVRYKVHLPSASDYRTSHGLLSALSGLRYHKRTRSAGST